MVEPDQENKFFISCVTIFSWIQLYSTRYTPKCLRNIHEMPEAAIVAEHGLEWLLQEPGRSKRRNQEDNEDCPAWSKL